MAKELAAAAEGSGLDSGERRSVGRSKRMRIGAGEEGFDGGLRVRRGTRGLAVFPSFSMLLGVLGFLGLLGWCP